MTERSISRYSVFTPVSHRGEDGGERLAQFISGVRGEFVCPSPDEVGADQERAVGRESGKG